MYRFLVRDAGGDAERTCLAEAIPHWVAEQLMEEGQPPKFIKILFFLTPHSINGKSLKKYDLLFYIFPLSVYSLSMKKMHVSILNLQRKVICQ